MTSRHILAAGITVSAALFLGACTGSDDASTPDTATATDETSTATETTVADRQTGDDPVFGAIDAVLAQHGDGIIVDIDREDDRETYDIDVVVGNEVIELEVDSDGTVREDEREGEDEDVVKAQAATVTAAEAIRDALNQHPDGILDQAELDEDDGVLRWKIELDDADRKDLVELELPAN
ncbi:PepSY domain-containing protein [Corynebacterium comes]|uniref:Peptidase propeptide and YPEB domain protein n=1 Tax=Corynebacterium comes TaxID=2675218 RepID=A0A6B8VVS7_9CORY|nr:PepSY domain-containing protein [Corynebacterium comes]QGU04211.1 Peptidase propeptide and YPEB domain protein [Corynebacterium comes]